MPTQNLLIVIPPPPLDPFFINLVSFKIIKCLILAMI